MARMPLSLSRYVNISNLWSSRTYKEVLYAEIASSPPVDSILWQWDCVSPGSLPSLTHADAPPSAAIAPYGLGPYSAHPAMDPAFAAHMMQSARYNPHSQASFYPVHPSISSSRNMPPVGFQQVAAAERYTGSPIGPDAGFGQPYPGRSLNAASHPNAAVPTAIPAQSSAGRASLFPGYGSGPTTSTLSTTSFSNTFDSQPGALYKQSSPLQAKPSGTSTDSLGLFSNGWRDGLRDGLA